MPFTVQSVFVICLLFPGLLYLYESNSIRKCYLEQPTSLSTARRLTRLFVTSLYIHSLLFVVIFLIYYLYLKFNYQFLNSLSLGFLKDVYLDLTIKNDKLPYAIYILIFYFYISSAIGREYGKHSALKSPVGNTSHPWAEKLVRSVIGEEDTYFFVYTNHFTNDNGRIIYTGKLNNFYIDSDGNFKYIILKEVKKTDSITYNNWLKNEGKSPWTNVKRNFIKDILHINSEKIFNVLISPEYINTSAEDYSIKKDKHYFRFSISILVHITVTCFGLYLGSILFQVS